MISIDSDTPLPRHLSRIIFTLTTCCCLLLTAALSQAAGQNTEGLQTRWAKEVSSEKALPEYPRPQLRRKNWVNLNGDWDYAIRPEQEEFPSSVDGKILVPFPIESLLSGVQKTVDTDERLWYRRTFDSPERGETERVLLHFGAVDWHTTVWVNGNRVGEHTGGYDPFSFDITEFLGAEEDEILVSVWDPTDAGIQPRGKQIRRPHGIWYTAVTGIWQTVWLEVVPDSYVRSLRMVPKFEDDSIEILVDAAGSEQEVSVVIRDGEQVVAEEDGKSGSPITVHIPNAKHWSPQDPHLYDVVVECGEDRVESYFGLREISIQKDEEGINRLFLNGKPLFQYGLLDQGWWPEGLYTAPTDEALRYDLEVTRDLGFNMVRKHVKVEPARWYYWCDKLGLLVWQDMPSGDKYIGGDEPDIQRSKESGDNFEKELKSMIDHLYNYPSIVMWVPYNEGWGQWDTERITELIKQWDPTRLVNSASGWSDRGCGDVHDIHSYPGPDIPPLEDERAVVLGEFGGLGLALPEHLWQKDRNWGYRSFSDQDELAAAYHRLILKLYLLVDQGLSAAVYTQTTDVEIEVNGILTYDREVTKFPKDVAKLHQALYKGSLKLEEVLPTSESKPYQWQYTFSEPAEGWENPDFDDAAWKSGTAGFGGNGPPNVEPRTTWEGESIWLRRKVEQNVQELSNPVLRIYHDEDADVYINGHKVASLSGFSTSYELVPIDKQVWDKMKPGPMTIAVHCKQTLGGQYIDLGLFDMKHTE